MIVLGIGVQLVGVTAMMLAAKYQESYPPEVRDFIYISDKAYNRKQILRMVSGSGCFHKNKSHRLGSLHSFVQGYAPFASVLFSKNPVCQVQTKQHLQQMVACWERVGD